MKDYLEFIQNYCIGLEGSSAWIWYKTKEGRWRSYGVAEDTIEESLLELKSFVDKHIIRKGGVNAEV